MAAGLTGLLDPPAGKGAVGTAAPLKKERPAWLKNDAGREILPNCDQLHCGFLSPGALAGGCGDSL